MHEDKRRLIIMGVILGLVILGMLAWGYMDALINRNFWSTVSFSAVALILIVFAVFLFGRLYSSVKHGYPLKDERSEKLKIHAAAWAFYIGIYWILFLMYLTDFVQMTGDQVAGGAIAGQAVIFGLSYWYLSRKGKV